MKTRYALFLILAAITAAAVNSYSGARLEDKISITSPRALFTSYAFITIAKFDSINTERMIPLKQFVWHHLDRTLSESYKKEIREVYDSLENRMFEYNAAVLAVLCTEPPEITLDMKRITAYCEETGKDPAKLLSCFDSMKGLPGVLTEFYVKARIPFLWEQVQPWYEQAITIYQKKVFSMTRDALHYVKYSEAELCEKLNDIVIIPHLIGRRGNAFGPTWLGVKYDIHTPWSRVSYSPHEFIHNMIEAETRSGIYDHAIIPLVNTIWDSSTTASARKYYPDKIAFFDECLVRTLDHVVTEGYHTSSQQSKVARMLVSQSKRGYVLCPAMHKALGLYEASGKTFSEYFPEYLKTLSEILTSTTRSKKTVCKSSTNTAVP